MRYLSLAEVLDLHRLVIAQTGGAEQVLDLRGLESAIAQPRATFEGRDLHPSLVDKAAALCFSLAIAIILGSTIACGYFSSGTWSDDPGNFRRAWGVDCPADLKVVHSWYWRSPHWSREESYYFQFSKHDLFLDEFVKANSLEKRADVRGQEVSDLTRCFEKPTWFAAETEASYDSWTRKGPAQVLLLRDKATSDFFIYVCQM